MSRFRRSFNKSTASGEKTAVTQSLQEDDEDDKKIRGPDDDIYWREWLEKVLESLTVTIIVMLLVLIDVINVVVTLTSPSVEETGTQAVFTFFVLAFFLVELCVCVCFITAGPITKLCAWGEEESGGHVL